MMKATNAIFIFCVLSVGFSNCKEDNQGDDKTVCTPQNTVFIPQDMKDRFYFNTGTWWVYKNVSNNDYDTLVLKTENYGINPVPKKIYGEGFSKCYEGYSYNVISQRYGIVNVTLSVNLPTRGDNTKGEIFVNRELFTTKDYITSSLSRFRWVGELLDTNINKIDSLLINVKMYNDILHYRYLQDYEASDYLMEAWYANKIGMVKMKRNDGSIWELIDYKVNQ
jgi:hypothetical protein